MWWWVHWDGLSRSRRRGRRAKLAERIAISSQQTFLQEPLDRVSGSTTVRRSGRLWWTLWPHEGAGGWVGGWTGQTFPQCVCVVHNCRVQPHPSQEFVREDRVQVPWGAITPHFGGRRCSLRAGLIRLGAQTNLMKDREPSDDARWLYRCRWVSDSSNSSESQRPEFRVGLSLRCSTNLKSSHCANLNFCPPARE